MTSSGRSKEKLGAMAAVGLAAGLAVGLAGALAAGGCVPRPKTVIEQRDEIRSVLPVGAELVAESSLVNDPLLFTAFSHGRLLYFFNTRSAASFLVRPGDRITLNAWKEGEAPGTLIELNGEEAFVDADSRATQNRFYFVPILVLGQDGQPIGSGELEAAAPDVEPARPRVTVE